MRSLASTAKHWDSIAEAEEDLIQATAGAHGRQEYADMCRRTAKALRLEIETGHPHCSCCLSTENWHK